MRKVQLTLCLILAISTMAYGDTVAFKQVADKPGTTAATWDNSTIDWGAGWNDAYKGASYYANWWLGTNTNSTNSNQAGLFAMKDLFTLLPAVNAEGKTLQINSANLDITQKGPTGGEVIAVNRVLTDWLLGAAGTNSAVVTGLYPDGFGYSMWVGGGTDSGYGTSDFTTVNQGLYVCSNVYDSRHTVDITKSLQDMYASGFNYGWALNLVSPLGSDPWVRPADCNQVGSDGFQKGIILNIDYVYVGGPSNFKTGDTDKNMIIDGVDLAMLSQHWDPLGTSGPHSWADGDFDGNGVIDGVDLAALAQNWAPLGYTGGQVPEPMTMSLLVLGGLGALLRRRK